MTETFYDILGVPDDATAEEIESAYREAIKEVHPDVSDDVDASERTARLNKAKDVLTDETERARYDRLGHEPYISSATPSGTDSSGTTGDTAASGPDTSDNRNGTDRNTTSTEPNDRTAGGTTGPGAPGGATDGKRTTAHGRRDRRQSDPGPAGPREEGPTHSTAARRQAAAASDGAPRANSSWNAWNSTRAWAVHQDTDSGHGLGFDNLFLTDQSIVLLASTFILYPFFVFSTVFPAFPLFARVVVGVCTLLTIMYLLSIPEVAVLIFGLWSLLVPLALLLVPGLALFSLVGLVALLATWLPFGFAVLTFLIIRPM